MTQTSHRYWTTKDAGTPFAELTIVEGEVTPDCVRIQLTPNTGALQLERTKIRTFCLEYLEMERRIEADELKRARDRDIVNGYFERPETPAYAACERSTRRSLWRFLRRQR